MKEDLESIDETDLLRHMDDVACRVEMGTLIQKRYYQVEKLLRKTQLLPEREFQSAFSSIESLVDSFQKKGQDEGQDEKEQKEAKKGVSKLITKEIPSLKQ
jgi:hypothetical protein